MAVKSLNTCIITLLASSLCCPGLCAASGRRFRPGGRTYASSRSGRASLRKPSIKLSASLPIQLLLSQSLIYLVVVVGVELMLTLEDFAITALAQLVGCNGANKF